MTDNVRQVLQLWDYGWCDHDRIEVSRINSPEEVIPNYLRSDAFCSSFVGPKKDFTPDLHGPFLRAALSEVDFEECPLQILEEMIEAIRQPEDFTSPASDEQWQSVTRLVAEISSRNMWCFRLRLTENDFDHFHDWGSVLEVFREFVFSSPGSETIERLIFGYD